MLALKWITHPKISIYKEFILTIEEMNKNLIAQNMNTKRLEVYINDWVLKNKIILIVISILNTIKQNIENLLSM